MKYNVCIIAIIGYKDPLMGTSSIYSYTTECTASIM